MSGPLHLVTRFFGSLSPRPLSASDAEWVDERLLAGERDLWRRMSRPDQKHAAGVAREVDSVLGQPAREVLAAALLHDVGKVDSSLGTFSRAVATLVSLVVGRERASSWDGDGNLGRIGRYLKHDSIGAELLEQAGSHALTVAWAREHHMDSSAWTVPREVGIALSAADDD